MDHKAEHKQRCAIVIELLDNWRNFYLEPAQSVQGFASDDPDRKVTLKDWTVFSSMGKDSTVVELARCLEKRQRQSPNHYRHLIAFTVYAEWRLVNTTVKVLNAQRKLVDKPERIRERIVPRWVVPRMVELATIGIVFDWDRKVKLRLPPALTGKLDEFTDQHGTHVTDRAA